MNIRQRVYQVPVYIENTPYKYRQCKGYFANVVATNDPISDNLFRTLGIVKSSWQLIQMDDLISSFEKYIDNAYYFRTEDASSLDGAYVARDYIFDIPSTNQVKIGDTVRMLIRISTGYSGGHSTRIGVGTLDLYCLNGMVSYSSIEGATKRHTKSANIEFFDDILAKCINAFKEQVIELTEWSQKYIPISTAVLIIDELPVTDKLKSMLYAQCIHEIQKRGHGQKFFALVSAYTAYASATGFFEKSTPAHIIHSRQETVQKWTQRKFFSAMLRHPFTHGHNKKYEEVCQLDWMIKSKKFMKENNVINIT